MLRPSCQCADGADTSKWTALFQTQCRPLRPSGPGTGAVARTENARLPARCRRSWRPRSRSRAAAINARTRVGNQLLAIVKRPGHRKLFARAIHDVTYTSLAGGDVPSFSGDEVTVQPELFRWCGCDRASQRANTNGGTTSDFTSSTTHGPAVTRLDHAVNPSLDFDVKSSTVSVWRIKSSRR